MTTKEIPAGLWLNLWASQQQEDRFLDGIREYVRLYYKEFCDATEIEPPVLQALETLFNAIVPANGDVEDIVREVEADINADGGIYSEWDGKSHKVATFPPEADDA